MGVSIDEQVTESAAILTVNAGSSSFRLDLVEGGCVLDCVHTERAVDPGSARRELSSFLGGHFGRDIAHPQAIPAPGAAVLRRLR
ncbi:hypothetical protein ACWDX9_47855, partial [Nonomuraea sp. NPDC003201]